MAPEHVERFADGWLVVAAVLLAVLAVAVAIRFEIRRERRNADELQARRRERWQQRGAVLGEVGGMENAAGSRGDENRRH